MMKMMKTPQLMQLLTECCSNHAQPGVKLSGYEALTPVEIEPGKAKSYIDALNFAYGERDVRNIAVTGPYGAGKSSVLLTWCKSRGRSLRVMTVSLADFEMQKVESASVGTGSAQRKPDGEDKGSEKKKANAEEKTIEYSILQQILYKNKKSELPHSRIERISGITTEQILRSSFVLAAIVFLTILTLLFVFPAYITTKLSLPPVVSSYVLGLPFLWRFSGFGGGLVVSLSLLLKQLHQIGLFDRKVNVDKIDILKGAVTTRPSSPSLLNVYIDEIVYFFETTRYNVVIFEDLDRFNDGAIFIKLREINQIINNCLSEDGPVKFIYAVRDELFSNPESRTKFFDFVLPVIPVMDSQNASEHFAGKFTEQEIGQEGFEECVSRISTFIPDMRVMSNITNEFRLYQNIVNNSENLPRLLAMIAYKNLCAEDYHGIDKKIGILFSLVTAYIGRDIQKKIEIEFSDNISKIKEEMEIIKKETFTDTQSIRKDILSPYISDKTKTTLKFYTSAVWDLDSVVNDESDFLKVIEGQNIQVKHWSSGYSIAEISADDVQKIKSEYLERCELASRKEDNEISRLNKEIELLNSNSRALYTRDLSYFIRRMENTGFRKWVKENVFSGDSNENLSSSYGEQLDFIYFLLLNSYISTDYMSYRSIFMAGGLSSNDNNFIKAVTAGKEADSTIGMPLEKVENVISRLRKLGVGLQENAQHPDVLRWLLENEPVSLQQNLLTQLEQCEGPRLIWLMENTLKGWPIEAQLQYMQVMVSGDELLGKLLQQLRCSAEHPAVRDITALLLCVPDLRWGKTSNSNKLSLKLFVQDVTDLIEAVPDGCHGQFIVNMKKTNISLRKVPLPVNEKSREIIGEIVAEGLYDFTATNIENIFLSLTDQLSADRITFITHPFTSIESLDIPALNKNLEAHLDYFIREIFIKSSEIDRIPRMLNSRGVSLSSADLIISKMDFHVHKLSEITNRSGTIPIMDRVELSYNLYSLLLKYDKLMPSWANFFLCLEEKSDIDFSVLIPWLNREYDKLPDEMITLSSESIFEQMITLVLTSELIDELALLKVLDNFNAILTDVPERIPFRNAELIMSRKRFAPTISVFRGLYAAFEPKVERLNDLLCDLVCERPSIIKDEPEVIFYIDEDFDHSLACQLLDCQRIPSDIRVGALQWLWGRDPAIFDAEILVSLPTLATLSLLLHNDELKHELLSRCLMTGEMDRESISSVLQSFASGDYHAFLADRDRSRRNIPWSEPLWGLAQLLAGVRFIRSSRLTHGDTRMSILPYHVARGDMLADE
ncbi:TPA: pcar [Yersinia enterocolitica]|nr:pcar [Yersinia enterocolitica]HDL7000543.1 pcar [Yersinia enterocolitica]HDL7108383.1 pcar [Yersinia enterocolitica]HDL7116853.1 pcar [Yersinia enterocolitica]